MRDVIETIRQWSATLPLWQREALRRMYQQRALTRDDEDALYALLKSQHGIGASPATLPWALGTDPSGTQSGAARLLEVSAVSFTNALAGDQRLGFLPEGLTVIYGDNGSGKSGYARIFKRACRSRDNAEEILPNVNLTTPATARASAHFKVHSEDADKVLVWQDGDDPIPELQSVVVFDARCATQYIGTAAASTYTPEGMDLMLGLVQACERLRARLKEESHALVVDNRPYAHLLTGATRVQAALARLSGATDPAPLAALAQLSEEETKELSTLNESVKEANPKDKARQLRLQAERITQLAVRCREQMTHLSDERVQLLRQRVEETHAAKQAAELASAGFRNTSGLLPGTGGDAWRALFEAARVFASHAHPGKTLAALAPEDACPLCQESLHEGAARLTAFDVFVEGEAEKKHATARELAKDLYGSLKSLRPDIVLDSVLCDELRQLNPVLCASLELVNDQLTLRRQQALAACASEMPWDAILALPTDLANALDIQVQGLLERSVTLEALVDETKAATVRQRHAELTARDSLAQVLPSVLASVSAMKLKRQLTDCEPDVLTHGVTQQAGVLNDQILTPKLVDALNAEFEALGVHDLHVELSGKNVKGTTQYRLTMRRTQSCEPARVLSEGEQRAVAIGAFLADLALTGSQAGVVFDDPVCSLDHLRRERVARRLAREAKHRQVIVLSHDLAFVLRLEENAQLEGAPCSVCSVERKGMTSGLVSDSLPMAGTKLAARLRKLTDVCARIQGHQNRGETQSAEELLKSAWVDLRLAWERGVEEVMLNGVVERFNQGVQTQRLKEVEVGDDEVRAVFRGMDRCNTTPHDPSTQMNPPPPTLADLQREIAEIKAWEATVQKQRAAAKARRGLH